MPKIGSIIETPYQTDRTKHKERRKSLCHMDVIIACRLDQEEVQEGPVVHHQEVHSLLNLEEAILLQEGQGSGLVLPVRELVAWVGNLVPLGPREEVLGS